MLEEVKSYITEHYKISRNWGLISGRLCLLLHDVRMMLENRIIVNLFKNNFQTHRPLVSDLFSYLLFKQRYPYIILWWNPKGTGTKSFLSTECYFSGEKMNSFHLFYLLFSQFLIESFSQAFCPHDYTMTCDICKVLKTFKTLPPSLFLVIFEEARVWSEKA